MIAAFASCFPSLTMPAVYAVCEGERRGRRPGGRHPLEVGVEAADAFVQTCELLGVDHARLKRLQPVLDADVVERRVAAGDPVSAGRLPPHRGVVIGGGAADPLWPEHLVEGERRRPARAAVATVRGVERRQERAVPGCAEALARVAVDRVSLRRRQGRPVRRQVVARAEQAALHDLDRGRERVGIRAVRLDSVQQPRVGGRDVQLHDRAAGAAGAHRVADRPVGLGHPLLHHHHRLGGERVVGVRAVVGERRGCDHEAAPQRRVVPDRRRAGRSLEAADPARRTEDPEELAVPALLRRPRVRSASVGS